jgi:lipopolysaccharide export system protein LptA
MKKVSSLFMLATLVLVLGVAMPTLSSAVAPQDNTQAQPPQQDKMQPPSDAAKVSVFTGKVMKAKGQYVLMDDSAKVTYALDNQEKAKAFNGKTVKVTGTLETASNTIHIENIEPTA